MIELIEIISVVPVKAILCSNPDKAVLIFTYGLEPIVGQLSYGIAECSLRICRDGKQKKCIQCRYELSHWNVVRLNVHKDKPLFLNVPYYRGMFGTNLNV